MKNQMMKKDQAKKIFDFVIGTTRRQKKEQDFLCGGNIPHKIQHKIQEEQGRNDALYIVENFETDVTADQVMSWASSGYNISEFIIAWGYYRNSADTRWISDEEIDREREKTRRREQEIRIKGPS